jgi:hypothetical protein
MRILLVFPRSSYTPTGSWFEWGLLVRKSASVPSAAPSMGPATSGIHLASGEGSSRRASFRLVTRSAPVLSYRGGQ